MRFHRYKRLFLADIYIKLKEVREYKINQISSLLTDVPRAILMYIFVGVLYLNFSELIHWREYEFLFFVLFSSFMSGIYESFYVARRLDVFLLNGTVSTFCFRPVSIFFQYFLITSRVRPFIHFIVYWANISLIKFFILLVYSIIPGFAIVCIFRFFDSFGFFIKNLDFLSRRLYPTFKGFFDRYPSIMFKNRGINFAYIAPNILWGAIATEYFGGYITLGELIYLTLPLFLVIIFCIFAMTIMWKYGLMKYEGYI